MQLVVMPTLTRKGSVCNPLSSALLSLHPLCGGGDLLFLLSPPPPLVSALTRKPLLGLFPNICSMHTGPGEFVW